MKHTPTIVLVFVSVMVTVLMAEAVTRILDGHRVFAMKLPEANNMSVLVDLVRSDGREHLNDIDLAKGVLADWFDQDPEYEIGRADVTPELARIHPVAQKAKTGTFEFYKLWNVNFLEAYSCAQLRGRFENFPGRIFAFVPPYDSVNPRYRYIPDTVTPHLLRSNNFGMRGPDISLRKPDNVIRIGFVGASTTVHVHDFPYSYPELIGNWLNLWAEANELAVRFETINLGREGFFSSDIAAAVRHELLPLEPDLVVYYEGSNQFDLSSVLRVTDGGASSTQPDTKTMQENLRGPLDSLAPYSALARRVDALFLSSARGAGEPEKPDYDFVWPRGVDEFDPPLNGPTLPVNLTNILGDLDQIRDDVSSIDAEMALISFIWLAGDELQLDPIKHKSIHDYLNKVLFPARYRDIERMAEFQNRVFAKYADTNDLALIDLAGQYPRNPDLFNDAIHQSYPGVRLRAWIVLQELIPIVRKRLDAGEWPRGDRLGGTAQQVARDPVITVQLDCSRQSDNVKAKALTTGNWTPNNPETEFSHQDDGTVRIVTSSIPYHYAAQYSLDTLSQGDQAVVLELQVIKGEISAGILSADGTQWLSQMVVNETPDQKSEAIRLAVPAGNDGVKTLMITNGANDTPSEFLITNLSIERPESSHIIKIADGIVFE